MNENTKVKKRKMKAAITGYFKKYGDFMGIDESDKPIYNANCQGCGVHIRTPSVGLFDTADPAHKIKDSRGGSAEADNLIILCRLCHTKLDSSEEGQDILKATEANSHNGLQIEDRFKPY